jgi:hypothetical protein
MGTTFSTMLRAMLVGVTPAFLVTQSAAEPGSEAERQAWVGRAISEGGALIDNARTTDPLDNVVDQWLAHANQQAARVDEIDEKVSAAKGKKLSTALVGEMMLLQAYTAPLVGGDKVRDILFKKQGDLLVCHLLFNSEEGLVDIVYCYNKDGVLTLCRIDSLPKGVFLTLPADSPKSANMFILWFSKSDVTLILDKTNPFNSIAR